MQPQSFKDPVDHPLDYAVAVNDIPEWVMPPWFDPNANPDWADELEAEAPPSPPSVSCAETLPGKSVLGTEDTRRKPKLGPKFLDLPNT